MFMRTPPLGAGSSITFTSQQERGRRFCPPPTKINRLKQITFHHLQSSKTFFALRHFIKMKG